MELHKLLYGYITIKNILNSSKIPIQKVNTGGFDV